MSRAPGSFFGWHVLFAAFAAGFIANFGSFALIGAFVTSVEDEFAAPGAVSHAVGVAVLFMGLVAPVIGRAIDRGNQRAIMLSGAALMSVGLVVCSHAQALWQLGLAFILLVMLGFSMFGPAPATALTSRWFVRRRGLAVAVTTMGATLSSGISPAIAAYLIELEGVGWRGALLWYGAGCFAVAFPVLWLFVVKTPEEIGQHPDGDPAPVTEVDSPGGYATAELARHPAFLLIGVAFGLLFASSLAATVHLIPYAERTLGIERQAAAFVLSAFAVCSFTGKLIFGAVIDRLRPQHAMGIAVVLLLVAWIPLFGTPSYPLFLAAGALLGLGFGGLPPLHAVMIGRCFGRASFGQVMGLNALVGLPLLAAATPLTGSIAGSAGYRAAFAVVVGAVAAGALLFMFVRLPGEAVAADGPAAVEPA